MNRVDIHFHILAGVDDGPDSMDQSIDLAAVAARERTGTIVATPHVRPDCLTDVHELPDRVDELRDNLRRAGVDVDVEVGAELGHPMVGRLRQSDLDTIALGPPGCRWLLVEAPLDGFTPEFSEATDELRDRGFAAVVAHPERAAGDVAAREAAIRHELAHGSVLQINAWSIAGRHGGEAQALARRLLSERHPAVLASDAHGGWRMPALELGVTHARDVRAVGGHAERLVRAAPRQLLEKGVRTREPVGA
jgi:protein-tyrosine phosphatase